MASSRETFVSLYRLVLRGASASVLHHTTATRTLRKLYRRYFDDAVIIFRELEDPTTPLQRSRYLQQCAKRWNKQMDNTLALLVEAATIRGTAQKVMRNASSLEFRHNDYLRSLEKSRQITWNPHLEPLAYDMAADRKVSKKDLDSLSVKAKEWISRRDKQGTISPKQLEEQKLVQGARRIFLETVKMAESSGGISLGKGSH